MRIIWITLGYVYYAMMDSAILGHILKEGLMVILTKSLQLRMLLILYVTFCCRNMLFATIGRDIHVSSVVSDRLFE